MTLCSKSTKGYKLFYSWRNWGKKGCLFVPVKSSSRWEFCKTKGDAIKFITKLSNVNWQEAPAEPLLSRRSSASKHPDASAKPCAKERIWLAYLEVFLLFLLFDFSVFSTLKVYQERSHNNRQETTVGCQKWLFYGCFWMSSTFFTVDFPLWWSSVSNNSVNTIFAYDRICKGLFKCSLTSYHLHTGRQAYFSVLLSSIQKWVKQVWGLATFFWSHSPELNLLCFLALNPCSHCHVLLLLICIHWSASSSEAAAESCKPRLPYFLHTKPHTSHLPTCSGPLWSKDPVFTWW